ncbi:MAG: S-layer homology domain-containing protein, partial [Proteocatella sp.]
MGDSNVTLYAKWTLNSGGGSTGGGGGGTSTTPTNPTTPPGTKTEEKNVPVIINGKVENAGTETITQNNGIKNVDMSVSGELVNKKIEEAVQQQVQTPNAIVNNVVEVPISAADANSINTKLTGDIVKKMDDNSFKLMINAGSVDYVIPANELKIENVAAQMGVSQAELKSIEVQIKINKVTEETAKQISENATKKNMAVVVSPVEFSIVANTTSKDGTKSEVTISKFTQYVERTIAIPEGVDPSKITTGVVYNDDGSFAHIPTEIVVKDSKYYARLNSPTNSKYSVIWNPVKVDSVKNHWSKESVEDMASRLVIDNPNSFEPNRAITRGEFIDVVTKGLGIYRPQTEAANKFNDVKKASKYYNGVLTGVDYGLINGYKDGSFKP